MEQSPSWEANRFSTSQEIPHILRNTKVHYRIRKCPPPVPILNQLDPVHTHTSYFLKSILILSSNPKWCVSLRFLHQNPAYASPLSHTSCMPRPSHSSRFYHPKDDNRTVKLNTGVWLVDTVVSLRMNAKNVLSPNCPNSTACCDSCVSTMVCVSRRQCSLSYTCWRLIRSGLRRCARTRFLKQATCWIYCRWNLSELYQCCKDAVWDAAAATVNVETQYNNLASEHKVKLCLSDVPHRLSHPSAFSSSPFQRNSTWVFICTGYRPVPRASAAI